MSEHDHRSVVPGCFRCELGQDEAQFHADVNALAEMLHGKEHPNGCDCDAKGIGGPWGEDAEAVLLWVRDGEGREVVARALGLQWVEDAVDTRTANPMFPRGNRGVRWHARRLVGKWETLPWGQIEREYGEATR